MKKTILFLVFCATLYQTNAQNRQDPNDAVKITVDFDQGQGRAKFLADNWDYCPYYVHIDMSDMRGFLAMGTSQLASVNRGEWQIASCKTDPNANQISVHYRFMIYRGNVNKKPNIDFAYSLPCKKDENVVVKTEENPEGYQLNFGLPTDTLYAARGGVMCNDNLRDYTAKGHRTFNVSRSFSKITVYHTDGTFGEYVFSGKPLVSAGANVTMGQPIAVLHQIENGIFASVADYQVNFSVYYLDKNKIKEFGIGNKHTHFRPFFQTNNEGKMRLEVNKTYISELTDEMQMQDMSKREKKQFLKNKEKSKKNEN